MSTVTRCRTDKPVWQILPTSIFRNYATQNATHKKRTLDFQGFLKGANRIWTRLGYLPKTLYLRYLLILSHFKAYICVCHIMILFDFTSLCVSMQHKMQHTYAGYFYSDQNFVSYIIKNKKLGGLWLSSRLMSVYIIARPRHEKQWSFS